VAQPICRVLVTGYRCTIEIGLDPNFTVCFKRDFMIASKDIERAKEVLAELESGQPLPLERNIIGIFGEYNGLGIWVRYKNDSHVFEHNRPLNPPRVICLQHHHSNQGFEMIMDYNETSLALVKQIVRALANHTI
jgi:hypothetical protein